MSRGRRYETEGKLNYQKVFAVIIAIIVIAMVVMTNTGRDALLWINGTLGVRII